MTMPVELLPTRTQSPGTLRLRVLRSICMLLALLLVAACATGLRVSTDMDPRADLTRYGSYAFYEPLAMEQSGYSTYLTDQIRASIRREMDARGYRFDPVNPDLRVNFQGIVRERIDVYTIPRTDFGYFYDYRARSYFGFPLWYDDTQVRQYTEGTLTVDLVDAARNHLVWTGSAIGRVTQRTAQERVTAADAAIASIFARFPYRAGSAQPAMPQGS